MRTAEFDAFGPWIAQVRTLEEVPRLYRGAPLDLAASRLVLKVPRNITRRDATPDMDLYDHLLVVGSERMTVLSRRGDTYVESVVELDQIAAIADDVNLLDGRLTVHTVTHGARTLHYNGTSHRVVNDLVALLRELTLLAVEQLPSVARPGDHAASAPARGANPPGRPMPALRELGDRDVALVTSARDLLRAEPQLSLRSAHGREVLVPRGNAAVRAYHVARPMTLQGAVVCVDPLELHVLCRRDFWVRGNRPVDSIAHLVVPRLRISEVTAREHPRYGEVSVVTVSAGATSIDLPVPAGSDAEGALLGCAP